MINQDPKPKIALIGYRLSGGGSDRVMANLSLYLEENGIDVHCITVIDEIRYPYGGKLFNMGLLKDTSNGLLNRWKRLKALKKYLSENQFDYIIDFRFRTKIIQELLIARWVYDTKTIFTIHSYLINHYIPDNSWLARLMYSRCFANVAINNDVKELVESKHHLKNVIRIYNGIPIAEIQKLAEDNLSVNFDYIIAVGRLDDKVKQFDELIRYYTSSVLPEKNIHLMFVGEGNLEAELKQLAVSLNVEDKVHFVGFQVNPFKYLKNARFTVLSSANEGLPMVLLESLACETPVVVFDCNSGPREIVLHQHNGLLVENQNAEAMIKAMSQMCEDEELYVNCRKNALESVQKFSMETIGRQWLELMKLKQ